jgi:nickel/cobalt transporter (NicO) family protein
MFDSALIGVVILGFLHGFEPGHGWPIAMLYSVKKKNPVLSAIISSSIIGFGHLFSSVAVVVAYVLLNSWLDFDAPWLKYVAAVVLLILAVKLWLEKPDNMKKQHGHLHEGITEIEHEHEHEHPGGEAHTHLHKHSASVPMSLWGLASFAFILGFAHEEEFALLALVAGGINAWVLMISYGVAVLLGLIFVTVASIKIYKLLQPKLERYENYVPKVSAAIIIIMAVIISL